MTFRGATLFTLLLAACASSAQAPDAACPANQPVDDLIATVQKAHSKKVNRNKNPLPGLPCIGGWCLEAKKTPKSSPDEVNIHPPANDVSLDAKQKAEIKNCEFALNDALHAAHNVEVGDQYLEKKNPRAAMGRYSEALEQKPSDAAIHVRFARAAEQLGEKDSAKDHYASAVKLGSPKQWVDEASAALQRIR